MKKVISGESVSDNKLLDVLKEKWKDVDPTDKVELYRKVLKGKKPESAVFLINNDIVGVERAIATAEAQTSSIIFEMQASTKTY